MKKMKLLLVGLIILFLASCVTVGVGYYPEHRHSEYHGWHNHNSHRHYHERRGHHRNYNHNRGYGHH